MSERNGYHGSVSRKELIEASRAVRDEVQSALSQRLEEVEAGVASRVTKALEKHVAKVFQEELASRLAGFLKSCEDRVESARKAYEAQSELLTKSFTQRVSELEESFWDKERVLHKSFEDRLAAHQRSCDEVYSAREQTLRADYERKCLDLERRAGELAKAYETKHLELAGSYGQKSLEMMGKERELEAYVLNTNQMFFGQIKSMIDALRVPPPQVVVEAPQVTFHAPEQAAPVVNVTQPEAKVEVNLPEMRLECIMPDRVKKFTYHNDGRPDEVVEKTVAGGH